MSTELELRTAFDGSVTPSQPARYGTSRLYVNDNAKSYVFFSMPILPIGSTFTGAKLRLMASPDSPILRSTATVSVFAVSEPFNIEGMTWGAQPAHQLVAYATDGVVDPTTGYYELDLSSWVTDYVSGAAPWFGFMLEALAGVPETEFFFGSQTNQGPVLVITYAVKPRRPTELNPGGSIVNTAKPKLSWNALSTANDKQFAYEVQVDDADGDFSVGMWTSGIVVSPDSLVDLSTTSFLGVVTNVISNWRVRVRNSDGIWSDWSAPSSFKYINPGTLTITGPATPTGDPTPVVTWTFVDAVQAAYQVLVTSSGFALYNSGIKYGSVQSHEIVQGIWKFPGDVYTIEVRVWDDVQRTVGPLEQTYAFKTKVVTYMPGGVPGPVQIILTDNSPWPFHTIKWQYTSPLPDRFALYRQRDLEPAIVIGTYTPAQVAWPAGGAGWYAATDYYVPGRSTYRWFVRAIRANQSSVNEEDVIKTIRNNMAWLMSNMYGPTYGCALVNAAIQVNLQEISDVVTPMTGNPFLVLQTFKGYMGSVVAELADDTVPGLTAREMRSDFLFMRKNPRCVFVFADEAIDCYIYNTNVSAIPRADGGTDYAIKFDFIEMGGNR